jgi:hypothetical protein
MGAMQSVSNVCDVHIPEYQPYKIGFYCPSSEPSLVDAFQSVIQHFIESCAIKSAFSK